MGSVIGLIPTLGPMIAVSLSYQLISLGSPVDIMSFYVSVLIAGNYTNGVTALIYGIPGDPTSIPTARSGHRLYRRGFGRHVIGSNALSSTLGVIIATLMFMVFFPIIFDFFKLYNSIVLSVVIALVLIGLIIDKGGQWYVTLLFILGGGAIAKVGVDQNTFESFLTFGNKYLNLGIPFMSVMIGLYVVPEFCKLFSVKDVHIIEPIKKIQILPGTFKSSIIGSVVGFWCGFVPGVTNILGSYASAAITQKLYKGKYSMVVSAAESANNSGALSSLLPMLILAVPVTGSEFLIYNVMVENGFIFSSDSMMQFVPVLYMVPVVAMISMIVAWRWYGMLNTIISFYSKQRSTVNIVLFLIVTISTCLMSPFPGWTLVSIIILSCFGFYLRKYDTVPIIYGFFLTHTFYESILRSVTILSN